MLLQTAYRCYEPPDSTLRNTEFLAATILILPMWSHLEASIASGISLAIERAHRFAEPIKAKLKEEGLLADSSLLVK